MTNTPTIAIVGGGLGGLTLARVLRLHDIPATVYELDASPSRRPQGGMLDIHEDTGQAALQAGRLHEQFRQIIYPGGQRMRILDRHAVVHRDDPDEGDEGRPEVERGQLRKILLDSLPADTIRWNTKVESARSLGDGRHELTFSTGSTTTCDLLVGADGAWSRIRPLVSSVTPQYAGIAFIEADFHQADERHPELSELVGGGMLFALGAGRGFLAHREPGGNVHVYIALSQDEKWVTTVDWTNAAAGKAVLLSEFADWSPTLKAFITEADGALTPRTIHQLPSDHRWKRKPGVTLLGDAAHLMSPFAGAGANLAMFDGAQLGEAIAASSADLEAALVAYEEPMFERSAEASADAAAGLDICFEDDAPQGLLAMFAGFDQ
jgi:2-polyprenyl-6-methoxyphenol hydroxylase-like FAD-dependent oxidoreductase